MKINPTHAYQPPHNIKPNHVPHITPNKAPHAEPNKTPHIPHHKNVIAIA